MRVVRKAKLWREERLDVARELVAHFSDGVGRRAHRQSNSWPTLVIRRRGAHDSQGQAPQPALWWQAWWGAMRLSLLALAFGVFVYAALTVRFYLGRPRIAHNYWQEINARRRVPEDEQAWPYYRTRRR